MSERIRGKLRELFRAGGRGTQAQLSKYLNDSPASSRKLKPPEITMMFQTGTRGIDIDTLEDVAAFFNLPVSDLLGIPSHSDLSASEQRMVLALRLLTPAQQAHILAIVETMSLHVRVAQRVTAAVSPGRTRGDSHPEVPETYQAIIARIDQDLRALEALESRRQATEARDRVPRLHHGD